MFVSSEGISSKGDAPNVYAWSGAWYAGRLICFVLF